METQVLVIGAGPGGLGAAAELKRRGQTPVVIDRADELASTWRAAYDRVRLNTVAWLSHLPGRRMPRSMGRWPRRDDYLRYLEDFVRDAELDVRLGVEARRLERDDGRWRVATSIGDVAADQVVVATGYSHTPMLPRWPGRDEFAGALLHSADYRNGEGFAGRRVLVVGAGNSGAEIAVDLVEAGAREVSVAIRTPPHVVVRQAAGVPNQLVAVPLRRAPLWLADRVIATSARVALGDLTRQGLPRPVEGAATRVRRDGAIPVVDSGFAAALRRGALSVVHAVERLGADHAVLADGRRLEVDAIVAATGYRTALEPLVGHLGILDERGLPRVHAAATAPDAPGLRFIGFTNPISGNLREMRLDSRRIAKAVGAEARRSPAVTRAPRPAPRCCGVPAR